MPKRLEPVYFHWVDDPQGDLEPKLVVDGHLRIVHARRASKLRKRGVPLQRVVDANGHAYYLWWESPESYTARAYERTLTSRLLRMFSRKPVYYNDFGFAMIKRECIRVAEGIDLAEHERRAVEHFFGNAKLTLCLPDLPPMPLEGFDTTYPFETPGFGIPHLHSVLTTPVDYAAHFGAQPGDVEAMQRKLLEAGVQLEPEGVEHPRGCICPKCTKRYY